MQPKNWGRTFIAPLPSGLTEYTPLSFPPLLRTSTQFLGTLEKNIKIKMQVKEKY
jgi:hypothetical protein